MTTYRKQNENTVLEVGLFNRFREISLYDCYYAVNGMKSEYMLIGQLQDFYKHLVSISVSEVCQIAENVCVFEK
jgi:hypothetical protein